jgi:Uma2 family endonuclease
MSAMGLDLLTRSPAAAPPVLGPYRRRDYDQLPEQPRHELLFGRLYVSPSPSLWHQVASSVLEDHFKRIARSSGGFAFHAPLDVILADHSIVQPDIMYVSAARRGIFRDHVEGAPDLVVEILSPGTADRDTGEKRLLYALSGVQEYWLAHRKGSRLEFLVNEGDRFIAAPPVTRVYRSPRIPEVRLDVSSYWRRVEAQMRRLRSPP